MEGTAGKEEEGVFCGFGEGERDVSYLFEFGDNNLKY